MSFHLELYHSLTPLPVLALLLSITKCACVCIYTLHGIPELTLLSSLASYHQVCVDTFHVAVEQATEFAGKLGGSPNYCGARGDDVLGAFKGFVDSHHRLFNILSHKATDLSAHRDKFPEAGDAVVSALTDVAEVGQVRKKKPSNWANKRSRTHTT